MMDFYSSSYYIDQVIKLTLSDDDQNDRILISASWQRQQDFLGDPEDVVSRDLAI